MNFRKMLGIVGFIAMAAASVAMANEGAPAAEAVKGEGMGLTYLASALAIGVAVVGGTFGQSRAAATALEGIARNPGSAKAVFTPMLLSLALIESLVLLAFVVAFVKIKG